LQSISVFNNKGGVGKTTLTFHLAHAFAELGKKTLVVDLDPQCNLTIFALTDEVIWEMWSAEDDYIDDFNSTRERNSDFDNILKSPRSIHFVLKPTEDGTAELPSQYERVISSLVPTSVLKATRNPWAINQILSSRRSLLRRLLPARPVARKSNLLSCLCRQPFQTARPGTSWRHRCRS
jgi:AAA domain